MLACETKMERNDGTTAICVARMKNISTDLVYIDIVICTERSRFYAVVSRCEYTYIVKWYDENQNPLIAPEQKA